MRNICLILLVIVCTIFSCQKKQINLPPTVITTVVSSITDSTAISGGTIDVIGPVNIRQRGVQWDINAAFSIETLQITTDGTGPGSYSGNLTGLLPATTYYVRAYAVNGSNDTTYGNVVQFTTPYVPGKYTVTTLAGTGASGSMDGNDTSATFHAPDGVTVDAAGNVYVADESDRIRKIIPGGAVSTLTTVPTSPSDVAVDSLGNVYVAAPMLNTVYKISPAGSYISFGTGFTSSTGGPVTFSGPVTLDIDRAANLYVGDGTNFLKISPAGVVTTLPSNFTSAFAIAVDSIGDVYESNRYAINKVTPGGTITFIAGGATPGTQDGTGSAAGFGLIDEMKVGPDGNIYVADGGLNKIRMVTPSGVVTTIAGTGAAGSQNGNSAIATFNVPTGLAIDKAGNIYVADLSNNLIRKISPL
jgi:serine/threonine protein kinase, bacterial